MTVVFFTDLENNPLPTEQKLDSYASTLPGGMKEKISGYPYYEKLLRYCGKYMIRHASETIFHQSFTLDDVRYSDTGKPYMPGGPSYNVSHSGSVVVCACSDSAEIGIDIEQIKQLDVNLLREHFTADEWNVISNNRSPEEIMYRNWVRKEAVMKASGKGAFGEMAEVDATADIVLYEGKKYFLRDLYFKAGYAACLAANRDEQDVTIKELSLTKIFA